MSLRIVLVLSFFIGLHQVHADTSWTQSPPVGTSFLRTIEQQYELSNQVFAHALEKNKHLSTHNTTFFNPDFLVSKNIYHHLKTHQETFERFTLTCGTDKIYVTYINRNSDKLVIVGHGFTSCKEKMFPFTRLLPDYDLVFFDFPGHGQDKKNKKFFDTFSQAITNAFITRITFGKKEVEYVTKIHNYFTQRKSYTSITGFGVCYSVFYFVQAAAAWEQQHKKPLFTHLILDSSWLSHLGAVKRLPLLQGNLYGLENTRLLQYGAAWITKKASGQKINLLPDLTQHLAKIKSTSILFIHSKTDKLCPLNEFNIIWDSCIAPRCGILLPTEHVAHYKQHKEIYALLCQLFIESPMALFIQSIQNINNPTKISTE